jgi:hypothetical protein
MSAATSDEPLFSGLRTLDDVRELVRRAYQAAGPAGLRGRHGTVYSGPLTLAVAEPGPLMVHAVSLAGPDGLSMQDLRRLFELLGKERFDRGIAQLRASEQVAETREQRPNRAGRLQAQVVFRRPWARPT